jgi:hypothetical protein
MPFIELSAILGNLGEFVGSIAVLGTLVYVSVQVNQSKELLERQSQSIEQSNRIAVSTAEAEMLYRNFDWYKSMINHPHMAELAVKLGTNETLNPVEVWQARAWASQLYQLWLSSESYYKNGLIDQSLFESMLNAPENTIVSMPGLIPEIVTQYQIRADTESGTSQMSARIRALLDEKNLI